MATLTFSYRSTKEVACLEARLSLRISGENLNPKTGKEMPYSYYTRSKIEVPKRFWKDYQKGVKFKDVDKANQKKKVDDDIYDLKTFVLGEFEKTDVSTIDKDWLKTVVSIFYNPPQQETEVAIPNNLTEYFKYYLEFRSHEISNNLKAKYNVVKHKLERFNSRLLVKEVNENFKKDFVEWCKNESYSPNTINRDLKHVKTVVKHARLKGLEVHPEFETLKLDTEKTPKIFLDFKELKLLQKLDKLPNYLDNARDWLIISCYTGQRVSDFMRFNKSMIRIENDVPLLEFTQAKTGVDMAIPILPEVITILEKRNGEFPHRISDQRYNEYIKEVCKEAKLTKKFKGKVACNISEEEDVTVMRKVSGSYPKWQLVTSHIGRRSFATNFYGKLPTTFLIGITGHSTERMFLNYIGKGQKDLAFDAYEYFIALNKK